MYVVYITYSSPDKPAFDIIGPFNTREDAEKWIGVNRTDIYYPLYSVVKLNPV